MALYKETKKKSATDEVFQPTEHRSYDTSVVDGWQKDSRESKATLSRYQSMIQRGDFLTSEDLAAYKKALDTYTSSAKRLRSLNKTLGGNVENTREWIEQIRSLNSNYDSISQYYSQWKTADEYKASQDAQKKRTAQLGVDLNAGAKEIEDMEAFYDDVFTIEAWYNAEGRIPTNPQDETYKANLEKYNKLKSQYGSVADLEKAIQDKKLYLNEAKRLQEWDKLGSVANPEAENYDPEFKQYGGYSSTAIDGTWDKLWSQYGMGYSDLTYEYINNQNGMRDEILRKGASFAGEQFDYNEFMIYDKMNESEISVYNYYYAKDGKEAAEKYLASIRETLNSREASERFGKLQDNTFAELLFGIEAGVDQFQTGLDNLGNAITGKDDYIPQTSAQMVSGMVREDLADDGPKLPEWMGGASLGQIGYDAVTTTTNMLPSILTSTVVGAINPVLGGAAGSALLGASASGNAYQEMLNLGYDKGQARIYAALVGGSEAGLQYLLGGIGKLGGKFSGNAISKVLSGVDNALARTAIKLGGNMLSEGFEEGLQEILTPWLKNLATGVYSEEVNWSEVAYSSLLGALTAGVMEGGSTISGEVNTYKTGKTFQTKDISAQRLADIGATFAADTVAYQLAGRVNENTGAYTLGRLFNEIGAELTEANKADIARELESRGVSAKDAKVMVDAMADVVVGGEFTDKQIAMLEANDVLTKAYIDVIVNPNSTVNQRSQGYKEVLSDIAKQKTSNTTQAEPSSQSGENVSAENTVPTEKEMPTQGDYEATVEGKTIRKSTGEAVSIKEVASVGNGKMTLRLEDGSEVDSKEIAYSNAGEAYVFETVANLGVDAVEATRIINAFRNSGVEGKAFADGMKLAFEYGYGNFSQQELAQKDFAGNIPQMYINTAYEIGQKMRQQESEQNSTTQEPSEKRTAKKREVYYTTKNGKVLSMSQAEKNGKLALKDKQSVAVKTAKFLQKLGLGGNYYFFESYVDEKGNRVFKDRFGNIQSAPNGLYYSDGDIYIDINAGTDSHSITLRTLSHELTHMIQQWSAAKYKVIADFLAEQYDKEGRNAYEAAKAKQAELSALRGKFVPFQEAYHEFVADSMSTLFDDGNMYDILTDLKKKDKSLADYIKKFFDDLAAKVRKLYANAQAETDEGQFVQGLSKDTIYRLQQMFAEALVEASENYAANSADAVSSATEVKVQHSTNSYGGVREVLAKKGLDELSKKFGSYFPLSAAFDVTMKADNTPLVMETVKANGVQRNPKESAFKVGRKSFISTYGVSTSVHIKQMDIDADLYANVANESISKSVGQPNEQSTLDVIPHIRKILENSVLMGVEKIVHTDKKGTALYGYRLYNLYWYDDGKVKTPHALACTVIQDLNKAEGYVFQNIENVTIDRGLPGTTSGMSSSVNGNTYTIAQLYRTVKKIDRDSGGLKYDTKNRDKYLFPYTTRNDGVAYQDRSATPSNRELLAQALEGVATDVEDFHAVKEYRRIVPLLDAEEAKLSRLNAQIREMSFGKGKRDTDKLFALRLEAKQTQNRIDIYDKQLLELEATAPLRKVLEREKAKAYKRAEQKGKEAVQKEKERAQAKYDELAAKNTASRKKAVEGRRKTEMRHKIQKVVKKLNDLLLNETKDHHIPSGLKKPVAEALDAIDVALSNPADQIAAIDEQIAKATTPEQAAELGAKKAKLEERAERFADKVNALKAAYDAIKQSPDMSAANSHDEVISSKIQEVSELIGETPLYDMSLSQLEAVYEMYRMIAKAVSNGNKAFKMARAESISQLGIAVGNEVTAAGGSHAHSIKALEGIKKFDWNNLKPVYAFERIGSQTFTELFNNVRAGEDIWAVDVTEARNFYMEQSKKYGYDQWDMKKQYAFKSTTGQDFQLTLEQIMSLYAYSKRDQAEDHLRKGGFVFDSAIEVVEKKHGIPVKYTVNTATAYNLSPEILADIVGTLTKEQTEFVDVMQDYLSTTMGAKGNEVSMALYDVKLFKEKHYFPLKSAKQYMFEQNEVAGEIRLKNSGFSKKTQPHASNPVILSNFMDVWAKHVNDMSMYHAFVLPLEDFNRVYNYKSSTGENTDTESVKGRIQNAYGAQANEYISQLITDLNGGARTDHATGIINKMIGLFKKGAVFASLSVVVQQPSAIARAAALVDTKYFIGPKVDHKRHKALWDEIKQHAPVAIIKEMGYFDTNMGKSTQDFITGKEYSGFTEKMKALVTDSNYRDELLSKAPALADEIAWCAIWEAVKRETKAKNPDVDIKSAAFMKKVGDRFTEVIVKTQVYDSVLSRSGLMRSKDTGMKMLTAFMAEPTTSINMIADALLQGKRGNRKYCRTAIGAVIASQILNSILVSFVYAGRDDDEDKTYVEKYIGTLTGEILDSLNPGGYIPFIKDIVSIVQGYDVERSDMAVVSDLWNAWQKLDSDKVSVYEKVEGFAGSIAQFFGLPLKNIMRDARGIYQTIMSFVNGQKTTAAGIGYAIKGSVTGKDVSNQQQLYEAYMSGDKEQISRVEGRFKDQSAINSAIRKALRENDPRIKEAAQAVVDGNATRRVQIVKEIIAEGHFETKDIQAAINAEIDKLREQAKEK